MKGGKHEEFLTEGSGPDREEVLFSALGQRGWNEGRGIVFLHPCFSRTRRVGHGSKW